MNTWCLLPVRSLADSKSRLAHLLTAAERGRLTGRIVRHTITTLQQVPAIDHILVVSRDYAVFELVSALGVVILPEGGEPGLNQALVHGRRAVEALGGERLLILPADLPYVSPADIEALLSLAQPDSVVLAPDEAGDGTNGMVLTPPGSLPFRYGPGSFERHKQAAAELGLRQFELRRPGLAFDLDTELDWRSYQARHMARGAAP